MEWLQSATPLTRTLVICTAFIALSGWCTLHNKFIFENVYQSSNCLLLVQNVAALIALTLLKYFGTADVIFALDGADVICGASYALNVMTGLWSLMYVNIAMFGALKRCTVVASWVIEAAVSPMPSTWRCVWSIALMTGGTIVASYYDLVFHAFGYLLACVSCVAQGSAFELGRRVAAQKRSVAQVLLANSVAGIAVQIVTISLTDEWHFLSPDVLTSEVLFHLTVNAMSCLAMNYAVFLNCLVNSPLAHAVTGNIKAVLTTALGVMLFSAPLRPLGWVGIIGNFTGAAWFTLVKIQENKSHRAV